MKKISTLFMAFLFASFLSPMMFGQCNQKDAMTKVNKIINTVKSNVSEKKLKIVSVKKCVDKKTDKFMASLLNSYYVSGVYTKTQKEKSDTTLYLLTVKELLDKKDNQIKKGFNAIKEQKNNVVYRIITEVDSKRYPMYIIYYKEEIYFNPFSWLMS